MKPDELSKRLDKIDEKLNQVLLMDEIDEQVAQMIEDIQRDVNLMWEYLPDVGVKKSEPK